MSFYAHHLRHYWHGNHLPSAAYTLFPSLPTPQSPNCLEPCYSLEIAVFFFLAILNTTLPSTLTSYTRSSPSTLRRSAAASSIYPLQHARLHLGGTAAHTHYVTTHIDPPSPRLGFYLAKCYAIFGTLLIRVLNKSDPLILDSDNFTVIICHYTTYHLYFPSRCPITVLFSQPLHLSNPFMPSGLTTP